MLLAEAPRINTIVPLSEHSVVANEFVLDFAECIGAFPTDVIDSVEDARGDVESGLRVGTLDGIEGGLVAIEDDTAQGSFDVAEQTMFNGVPLRGIGRIVGDAQG